MNFAGSEGEVDDSATGAASAEVDVSAVVARYRAVAGKRIRDEGNSDLSRDVMVMGAKGFAVTIRNVRAEWCPPSHLLAWWSC